MDTRMHDTGRLPMSNPFGLNTEKPSVMWIDLNSAFATAEQQHSLYKPLRRAMFAQVRQGIKNSLAEIAPFTDGSCECVGDYVSRGWG